MSTWDIIVADPPWGFDDGLKAMKDGVRRSAQSQYSTLSIEEIKTLNVKSLADSGGCLLALWVPGSMLQDGLDVVKAWGHQQKQVFVWTKMKNDYIEDLKNGTDLNKTTRIAMGRLFRQTHEIALICTSGRSVYRHLKDKSQRSVAFDINKGHSIKPDTLQDRLEIMFPEAKKLELFARRQKPGWTCVGDAIDGKDIRDVIPELISQE